MRISISKLAKLVEEGENLRLLNELLVGLVKVLELSKTSF